MPLKKSPRLSMGLPPEKDERNPPPVEPLPGVLSLELLPPYRPTVD
jgi:hypothetical protein